MRIVADTNVLLRTLVSDNPEQGAAAGKALESAELVAISSHVLCEMVWVLRHSYGIAREDVSAAVRRLIETRNVAVDRPAVDAGLAMLDAGGDFADGVILHQGRWLGGETFLSFDKKAVALVRRQGRAAALP